jgi:hypothetical protein
MSMPAWAPIVMKMNFVVVPSGTDPEGSTTKAIFLVILFQSGTVLDCILVTGWNVSHCEALFAEAIS